MPDDDDDLDEWLEEVEEIEEINDRNALKDVVLQEIALQHPVIFDSYNLCDIYEHKELTKFSVKMLKEICSELEIKLKSRDTKMTIVDKLTAELSKCTCN